MNHAAVSCAPPLREGWRDGEQVRREYQGQAVRLVHTHVGDYEAAWVSWYERAPAYALPQTSTTAEVEAEYYAFFQVGQHPIAPSMPLGDVLQPRSHRRIHYLMANRIRPC